VENLVTALLETTHNCFNVLEKGKEVGAVFFDFRRAFKWVQGWSPGEPQTAQVGFLMWYHLEQLPHAISLWNNLPSNAVILPNVHNFKEAMYEYFCT